jgi:hypothetical protein
MSKTASEKERLREEMKTSSWLVKPLWDKGTTPEQEDPEKDAKIREAIGVKPASPTPRIVEVPIRCGPEFCIINGKDCQYANIHDTYIGSWRFCSLFQVSLEADEHRRTRRCDECLQAEIDK